MFDISIESVGIIVSSITAISVVALGFFQYRLARQLYKLEKDKVKLELYNKRYNIYLKLRKFIALVINKGTCDEDDLLKFLSYKKEADFLFNDSILIYLETVYKKGVDIMNRGESTTITPEKMGEILKWFGDQFEESTKKFAPYLDFSNLS
jgi:hypothetical protein